MIQRWSIPSGELKYPTLGKGKSSTQKWIGRGYIIYISSLNSWTWSYYNRHWMFLFDLFKTTPSPSPLEIHWAPLTLYPRERIISTVRLGSATSKCGWPYCGMWVLKGEFVGPHPNKIRSFFSGVLRLHWESKGTVDVRIVRIHLRAMEFGHLEGVPQPQELGHTNHGY